MKENAIHTKSLFEDQVDNPKPEVPNLEWEIVLSTLTALGNETARTPIEDAEKFQRLIARIYKKVRKERRRTKNEALKEKDKQILASTTLVRKAAEQKTKQLRQMSTAKASNEKDKNRKLNRARRCYCCLQPYRQVHEFYHYLCSTCAEVNLRKREQRADLSQRYAIVTGGRVKIGFQTALKLLRDGAHVTVTTRFAVDAYERYTKESDFLEWAHRLNIVRLDFRDLPKVLEFTEQMSQTLPYLDILVNNAAQTVRTAKQEYAALKAKEVTKLLPRVSPLIEALPVFVDRREVNGWTQRLHEIEPLELVEVLLINTAAPFLITARLKALLQRSTNGNSFVINVNGRDGHFTRKFKSTAHPHVNVSKAGLNMLTRTSAADFLQDNIFMNSVDVGWVSLEGAYSKKLRMTDEEGFVPPLDAVDAAARIYDPIVRGLAGEKLSGLLFKHYAPVDF